MGLLSKGSPFSWEDTKKYAGKVREQGVKQFIHQYRRSKDRVDETFLWGDEVCDIYHDILHEKSILG